MRRIQVGHAWEDFRTAARALLAEGAKPADVSFVEPDASQLGFAELAPKQVPAAPADAARVPKRFVALGELVAAHRSPARWNLLYDALYRLTHGEPRLLSDPSDATVLALLQMRKNVERDIHKTHAFVRFRRVEVNGEEHFIAWHEPQHRTLALAAPHFVRRFSTMRWSIMTPDATASWDLEALHFSPGVAKSEAPGPDALEALWRTYYQSVFNPARLNVRAMRAELPRRHWKNLPEAELISKLVKEAPRRAGRMVRGKGPSPALELVPEGGGLANVRAAAKGCLLCPWAKQSTQTVFGEGPAHASIMLVGEQPGDVEDQEGRPFAGPAGLLLDRVLGEVGLPRSELYVTNAVKHFKFERNGKRRIHQKPGTEDIHVCHGWLETEVRLVKPRIIVALGATAGQAFLGPGFRITRSRGEFMENPWAEFWLATYHPSALLRAPDEDARVKMEALFRQDLEKAAAAWRQPSQRDVDSAHPR